MTVARFLAAIGLVLVLWLLRHLITALIVNPLRKLVQDTDQDIDDAIFRAVDGSISWFILGLSVLAGVFIIGLGADGRAFGIQLAVSLLVVAVFKVLYELSSYVTRSPERLRRITRLDIDRPLIPIARVGLRAIVILSGIFAVANVWGINLTGLLTGLGIGGLALSLAAKEVLDDVLGYMVIMSDDVFTLDEYIVSPHAEGIVERIGIRSSRIRRLDQGLTIVPNSVIVSDELVNWSRLERRWFNFMLGLQYNTPADQVEAFSANVADMLRGREAVDPDSVVVLFTQYDDSSLNLLVRSYVDIADWTESKQERHAVNLEIARIADEMDVSMAFPSRSLYLEKLPSGVAGMNGNGNGSRFVPEDAQDNRERTRQSSGAPSYSDGDPDPEIRDGVGEQDGNDGEY